MKKHVLALLAMLLVGAVAYAQDSRGSIAGTVTDSQKAIVGGATVTVTNTETNSTNHVQINQTGYFEVNLLNPGTYSVSVELAGFKKTVRTGLILNVSGRVDVDFQLEVGQANQTIEVSAESPLLDTATASGGRVLNTRDMTMLPYTSMNPFALTALTAGMQFTGNIAAVRTFDNAGTASFNTSGGVGVSNEYTVDGAPVTGTNGARVGFAPSAEAVGEVRVESTPFDAASGHTSGASVSVLTRSGTNSYHGSVNDQHIQNRWNATPHFTRLQWEQDVASGKKSKDSQKQASGRTNQFGASLGGPVRIPKLYNGKDKLFFFLQYGGYYQRFPTEANITVPKLAWRQGDFSDLLAVDAAKYTIYDPRSATLINGRVTRTPFPGNKGIPILNPAYDFWLRAYPNPNDVAGLVTPEGTNNYFMPDRPQLENFNTVLNRFDYNATDKHRFNGKWYWNHRYAGNSDWANFTPLKGLMDVALVRINKGGNLDYSYAINSNTMLTMGANITRFTEGADRPIQKQYKPSDLKLPAYIDQKAGSYVALPAFTISGIQDVATASIAQYPSITQVGTTEQFKVGVNTVRGAHSLKYGWDGRRYYYSSQGAGYSSGRFQYDNRFMKATDNNTTASNSGLGWAAFMMALPHTVTIDSNDTGYYASRYHGLYLQDDYRLTTKIRFGFGLRFERESGTTERFNRGLAGGFDYSYKPPYADAAQAAYAKNPVPELPVAQFQALGGVSYLGTKYKNYSDGSNRFLPNVSMVWQWNSKTVLRTGYGWFSDVDNSISGTSNRPSQDGFSQTTTTTTSNDLGLTFCCGVGAVSGLSAASNPMTNPFPVRADGTRFDVPYGASVGADVRDGSTYTIRAHDFRPAKQQRWRVGVQREITKNMVLDVSYNGAYATTPLTRTLSYLPEQYWAKGNTRNDAVEADMTKTYPNPFLLSNLTGLQSSNPTLYKFLSSQARFTSSTLQKQQLLRAFPNFTQLTGVPSGVDTADYNGENKYHDLQIQLEQRFSHGFQGSFVYTRAYGRSTYFLNEYDQQLSWQNNNNIRPNRLALTFIYELPFGKGRAFVNHNPVQHVVGGWQVSGIYQFQDGNPLAFANRFYYGDINTIGSVLNHDKVHADDIHVWFDPNTAFRTGSGPIPANFVGFEGRAALQPGVYQSRVFPTNLEVLRADGIRNWDLKLYRKFVIHEQLNFNFSVDMLNATNHTNFNAPNLDPTNASFGRVTSQNGLSRQIQMNLRIDF